MLLATGCVIASARIATTLGRIRTARHQSFHLATIPAKHKSTLERVHGASAFFDRTDLTTRRNHRDCLVLAQCHRSQMIAAIRKRCRGSLESQ